MLSCQRVLVAERLVHDKSTCRLRNAKCITCGKTGHLKKVSRQREKSAGKTSSFSSNAEGGGKGGKNHSNNDIRYYSGQPGHRRPDDP